MINSTIVKIAITIKLKIFLLSNLLTLILKIIVI